MVNLASLDFVAVDFTCRLKWSSGLSGSALKVVFADEELDSSATFQTYPPTRLRELKRTRGSDA